LWAAGAARKGNGHTNEQQNSQHGQQAQPPRPVVRGRSVLYLHAIHDQAKSELDRQAHDGGIRAYHRPGRLLNGRVNSTAASLLNTGQQAQCY
jgi:hypothetical protein